MEVIGNDLEIILAFLIFHLGEIPKDLSTIHYLYAKSHRIFYLSQQQPQPDRIWIFGLLYVDVAYMEHWYEDCLFEPVDIDSLTILARLFWLRFLLFVCVVLEEGGVWWCTTDPTLTLLHFTLFTLFLSLLTHNRDTAQVTHLSKVVISHISY